MMNYVYGQSYMMYLMPLFWLGAFAVLVYLLFKMASKSGNEDSIEILKERFARGEIDKEEFEERLNELKTT